MAASQNPADPAAGSPARRLSILSLGGVLLLWSAGAVTLLRASHGDVIGYDGGYNASVAKNVALGFGYRSSYHEWVAFNPDVTTGPVVLLPLAVCIRLFGNGLDTPMVWQSLSNLGLLALVLALLWRGAGVAAPLIAMAGFLALDRCFGLRFWYEPRGDVPGALLLAIGTLLLFRRSRRSTVVGALCLGLAPGTKLLCLTGTIVALVWLVAERRLAERDGANGERRWPALLAAASAPTLLWLAYCAATLRRGFWDTAREWRLFVLVQSGATTPAPHGLGPQLLARLSSLGVLFGGTARALVLLALVVAAAIGLLRRDRPRTPALSAARALLATVAVQLAYWLFIDRSGFARHIVIAALLLPPVIAIGTLELAARPRRIALAGGALLVASLWIAPPALPPDQRSPADVRDAVRFLSSLERDRRTLLVGYGWWANRTLEYALPGSLHFRDATRLRPDELQGRTLYLVRSKEFWNWGKLPRVDEWASDCERDTVFDNREFRVSRCARLPLD